MIMSQSHNSKFLYIWHHMLQLWDFLLALHLHLSEVLNFLWYHYYCYRYSGGGLPNLARPPVWPNLARSDFLLPLFFYTKQKIYHKTEHFNISISKFSECVKKCLEFSIKIEKPYFLHNDPHFQPISMKSTFSGVTPL